MIGLVIPDTLFVLVARFATVWNLGVVHPALSDYEHPYDTVER